MMLKNKTFLLASCLLCANLSATDFIQAFPEETLFYVEVDDWRSLYDTVSEGEVAALLDAESFEPLLKPIYAEFGIEPGGEVPPETEELFMLLKEGFTGGFAFGVAAPTEWPENMDEAPHFIFAAHFSEEGRALDEKIDEAWLKVMPDEELFQTSEDFYGTEIIINLPYEDAEEDDYEFAYCFIDDITILSDNLEALRSAIIRVKDSELSLAGNPTYQEVRTLSGAGGFFAFINLQQVDPLLRGVISGAIADSGPPPGFDPVALLDRLRLDVLRSGFAHVDYSAEGAPSFSGLLYDEKAGILNALDYTNEPLPRPGFVPEDIVNVSIANFDFANLLREVETIITAVSPMAAQMYQMQLESAAAQVGLDVRGGLLDSLGTQIVQFAQHNADDNTAATITALGLRDAQTFEMVLEGIKSVYMGNMEIFEESEYMGERLYQIKQPEIQSDVPRENVSYALSGGYLLLAQGMNEQAVLREAIAELKSDREGFLTRGGTFDQALEQMPPSPIAANYIDAASYANLLLRLVYLFNPQIVDGEFLMRPESEIEKDALPYVIMSTSYEEEDGLFQRSRFFHKDDLEN